MIYSGQHLAAANNVAVSPNPSACLIWPPMILLKIVWYQCWIELLPNPWGRISKISLPFTSGITSFCSYLRTQENPSYHKEVSKFFESRLWALSALFCLYTLIKGSSKFWLMSRLFLTLYQSIRNDIFSVHGQAEVLKMLTGWLQVVSHSHPSAPSFLHFCLTSVQVFAGLYSKQLLESQPWWKEESKICQTACYAG